MGDKVIEVGEVAEFDRKKYFRYVKPLGGGGTGDTFLFEDVTTKTLFAFKKYSPKGNNDESECYIRFVEEIKILYKLSHPNIVRVYNSYLYPEKLMGYLQMEYIEGKHIDEYINPDNPFDPPSKDINALFVECIKAFQYLETKGILHRDIKASNILVDNEGNVKVIDFGFSKDVLEKPQSGEASVLILPQTQNLPDEEVYNGRYTVQTDIYYLGKLFEDLAEESATLWNFEYSSIIAKMTKQKPEKRYQSFLQISQEIIGSAFSAIFTAADKVIYQKFADQLLDSIVEFTSPPVFQDDLSIIILNLGKVLEENVLEDYIQANNSLIGCFGVNFNYKFWNYPKKTISTAIFKDFFVWIKSLSPSNKKLVLKNIQNRFSRININDPVDLPF